MFGYADRTHTRSASAMRGSKCFMQIQMADISTDKSGVGQAYLCIHIGAVHVDLCTACMDTQDAVSFSNPRGNNESQHYEKVGKWFYKWFKKN